MKAYRLAKFLTPIQTEFFQYLSSSCTYLWGIHSLKNNSAVSRSGYLYRVNQKYSLANALFPYKKNNQKLYAKYYDGKWKQTFC